MRIHQLFLFSLSLALSTRAAGDEDEVELRQLTDDNFKSSTAQGVWLVEHYSPRCGHCRAFAPTWEALAEEKQHLERLAGFHMAQVNCLAQGDLCTANDIKFYPQILLFVDGQMSMYTGDRSHSSLSKYIDEQAMLYARGQSLAKDSTEESVVSSGFGLPNPEGKVLEVDEKELDVLKSNGVVLVEYFAPWCGHCKKLKPTWDQLAESLKGKLNVASVNCDQHQAFCRREGVQGYPTIRMLKDGGKQEFAGPRSFSKLQKFAASAMQAKVLQPIKFEEFSDIAKNEDNFFLYLQNFDTSVSDLEAVRKAMQPLLKLGVPSYTSSDPLLYANLSIIPPVPTSLLIAFSQPSIHPVATLPFPLKSSDKLTKFVDLHRYPTIVQLSTANYNSIMKSPERALIVLGAVHGGDEGFKERMAFERIARAWKKGGRAFEQPVWFVWLDGHKWARWLKKAYGVKKGQLPAAIVLVPANNEYYDMTIEGTKLAFEGASVFSVLEGVWQHFLLPKKVETTLEWGSRSATLTLIGWVELAVDHPFVALMMLVGGSALFVFILQRCQPRKTRDTEKSSGLRLD